MPRPKLAPRKHVHLLIPEDLYAELILLRPELQDSSGFTKYGGISGFFTHLLRKDLEELKTTLRFNNG